MSVLGILEQRGGGGSFPVIVSVSFNEDVSPPHTANLPATTAGDLLIILITQGAGADPNATPSGWTQLIAGDTHAFFKWPGTAGASTVTISFGSASSPGFTVLLIRSADTGQNPTAVVLSGSIPPDPPSLDPAWADANNLFIVYVGTSEPETITSYPDGYSLYQSGHSGAETSSFVAAKEVPNSSAQNPGTFTISSSSSFYRVFTIAVKGL